MSEPTKEDLKRLQKQHMQFLEGELDKRQFVVSGVPMIRCFNYKLIQIINNVGLRSILEAGASAEKDES